MNDKDKQTLGIDGLNKTLDDAKKSYENDGYTCK